MKNVPWLPVFDRVHFFNFHNQSFIVYMFDLSRVRIPVFFQVSIIIRCVEQFGSCLASKLCKKAETWRVQWRTIWVTDPTDYSAMLKACV